MENKEQSEGCYGCIGGVARACLVIIIVGYCIWLFSQDFSEEHKKNVIIFVGIIFFIILIRILFWLAARRKKRIHEEEMITKENMRGEVLRNANAAATRIQTLEYGIKSNTDRVSYMANIEGSHLDQLVKTIDGNLESIEDFFDEYEIIGSK